MKPHQRAIVFLAGPLPGLLLGLALAAWGPRTPDARMAAGLLIALNYANLVPLMPLDGGQILRLVFLPRWTKALGALMWVSIVGLSVAAVWLEAWILLILPLVLGTGLGYERQLAEVAKLHAEAPDEAAFDRALVEGPLAALPFPRRAYLAHMAREVLPTASMGRLATAAVLAVYAAALAVGPVLWWLRTGGR